MFKSIIKLSLLLSVLLTSFSQAFAGGPWLVKKGGGYFQVQVTPLAYAYGRLLNGIGTTGTDINREVYAIDYGLYGEYGLTDKLNLLANIPFKYARVSDLTETPEAFPTLLDEGSINGLSNLRLGLKYGILDKNLKIAVSAQTSLNTVSTETEKGLATGFQGTSAGLMAHVGGNFGGKWYAFGELGFQHMFSESDFDDSIEASLEIGRSLNSKYTLLFRTIVRESLKNGSFFDERLEQTGLYPSNQSWIAGSFIINYESPDNYGFNFGMPLVPIRFTNVGYTGSFTFGAYMKI